MGHLLEFEFLKGLQYSEMPKSRKAAQMVLQLPDVVKHHVFTNFSIGDVNLGISVSSDCCGPEVIFPKKSCRVYVNLVKSVMAKMGLEM